ncbi:MAG: hypothetical protein A2W01_07040 [Candidatus Solincola sediminis]|uniref:Uncharacterized protein n=1 Tax=Candidatus Solincola sediminis TaxID=1797199 RepID=A0A1F2WMW6_9ACTN|nr:MAG: hypothetical protein A2W01_07040 [Candidatus Solincola sediminis]OFW58198.1 MAG: hypothetical protein A2Y75_08545 [Candidatus Solincola sediminis]
MKVLFIHSEQDPYTPSKPLETLERLQFGISYISSVLKEEGHRTALLVVSPDSVERVEKRIAEFDPGLICFTSVFTEFHIIQQAMARSRKAFPGVFAVLGGPHATLNPEECLKEPVDAVCVGEGEFATLELAKQSEAGKRPHGIPNLYIKKADGSVERNKPRPFIEDLDSLPFPDRDMWLPWVSNPFSRPSLLVGRGCPFQCTYCCNHALRHVAEGKYVRLRSPANIVAELENMKGANPYLGEVYLEVETLGVKMEWALELCDLLRDFNATKEIPVVFGTNLRVTPNRDYNKLFAALASSNFRFVNIGLESGSERVRREILNRRYSNRDIENAVETARKHGLQVGFYNLIGLPGETKADFKETVKVNRICQPDWFLTAVFFPYPGTKLHDTCSETGLLDQGLDTDLERRKPILELPGFTKRQQERRRAWFPWLIYRGKRPWKELIWLVAMAKVYSNRRMIKMHRWLIRKYFLRRVDDEYRELIEACYTFDGKEPSLEEQEPVAVVAAAEGEKAQ